MQIPLWFVKILAWITLAAVAFGWLTILLVGIVWIQDRFFRAAKLFLCFFGSWAAYINYTRVQVAAAKGGHEWFNSLITPQPKGNCTFEGDELDEPVPTPIPYFKVEPRPELWRWWMRLLGAKKPQA